MQLVNFFYGSLSQTLTKEQEETFSNEKRKIKQHNLV